MSTISASTTSTTAYKVTADTTGTLVLQTGASPTTALTIDTSQNTISTATYQISTNTTPSTASGNALFYKSATGAVFSGYQAVIETGSAGSRATAVLVDPSGNVGIGTTPGSTNRLHVNAGNANTSGTAQFRVENTNGQTRISMSANQTNNTVNFIAGGSLVNPAFTWINNDASLEHMRLNADGNLGIGGDPTTNRLLVVDNNNRTISTAQVQIIGSGYSILQWLDGTAAYIGQNSGGRDLRMFAGGTPTTGVKLTPSATSWASTSDEREKDIIEPIADATQKLSGLRTVIGKYKTDEEGVRRSFLIAQDVEAVFPEAISEAQDGILSLRYTDLIPVLVKAIQELKAELDTAKADIATLKGAA